MFNAQVRPSRSQQAAMELAREDEWLQHAALHSGMLTLPTTGSD
jgi:hypothetical protein